MTCGMLCAFRLDSARELQHARATVSRRHIPRGTQMTSRKRDFRAIAAGVLAAAGLALAPSAFAHGGVSIGINVPGLSIGVGPHHHAYVGIGGGGYYSSGYAPAYYAPAPVYYDYDDGYYSA